MAADEQPAPTRFTRAKRPTMRDIAAHVGVSQALVSLVFRGVPGASEATRARIFQAAGELGYRPDTAAQLLRSSRSRQLGVLFALQQPYQVDLAEALYPAANRAGYRLVLGAMLPMRADEELAAELLDFRCEALILLGPEDDEQVLVDLSNRTAVVVVGRPLATDRVDVVRVADDHGAMLVVDHLVQLGHQAIAHISGGDMPAAADRRSGYRDSMERHGLRQQIRIIEGDFTEEAGAHAARSLLTDGLPTAIFAGNDRCAHGLLDTLVRAGVDIPGDVSVVGYDDSRTADLSFIRLTTVRQDCARIADLVVEAVSQRLDGGRTCAREIVLDPVLVIRGTTGRPSR